MNLRRFYQLILLLLLLNFASQSFALLSMELTRGAVGAIPIAIVPFANTKDNPNLDISAIIANDLKNSGRFKVTDKSTLTTFPSVARDVNVDYFHHLGTDNLVIGTIKPIDSGRYEINFQLVDIYPGQAHANVNLSKKYTVNSNELRAVAHHISDLVYERLTGTKGVFSTKLAYVVIQRPSPGIARYNLELSDQDGFNPKTLLTSSEPIMSPAWSPNGKQLAYVSFENRRASIYIQDIATGKRRLISQYPGINGAPAFSPDGLKLAVVLSKSGAPNIYVIDLATNRLSPIAEDYYINTEPVWSADGLALYFTSNRSGGPQIYQANLKTHAISRVSYDGDYNARATFARDGKNIAMIHRVANVYHIAILNLDTGITRVLSSAHGDSSSPSVAPNGSMILYDTIYKGQNMLAMVSSDGRIQLILPARNGEAQDPAWSPFLS